MSQLVSLCSGALESSGSTVTSHIALAKQVAIICLMTPANKNPSMHCSEAVDVYKVEPALLTIQLAIAGIGPQFMAVGRNKQQQ